MTEINIVSGARRRAKAPPRMTSRSYLQSFVKNRRIRFYILLSAVLSLATILTFGATAGMVATAVITLLVMALLEYSIHRFVYHNRFLYRFPLTAKLWRFLHYSHHMDPNDASQFVGPPQFAIPVIVIAIFPIGWIIGGTAGAATAVTTGFWLLIVYEYAHGFSHMVTQPAGRYGRMLRHMHMLHHFHNEKGNYGVTSPAFDLLFGTYYADASKVGRCPTARNLGYTAEEAKLYPWASQGDPPKVDL